MEEESGVDWSRLAMRAGCVWLMICLYVSLEIPGLVGETEKEGLELMDLLDGGDRSTVPGSITSWLVCGFWICKGGTLASSAIVDIESSTSGSSKGTSHGCSRASLAERRSAGIGASVFSKNADASGVI